MSKTRRLTKLQHREVAKYRPVVKEMYRQAVIKAALEDAGIEEGEDERAAEMPEV